jgi:hypothetical protein
LLIQTASLFFSKLSTKINFFFKPFIEFFYLAALFKIQSELKANVWSIFSDNKDVLGIGTIPTKGQTFNI